MKSLKEKFYLGNFNHESFTRHVYLGMFYYENIYQSESEPANLFFWQNLEMEVQCSSPEVASSSPEVAESSDPNLLKLSANLAQMSEAGSASSRLRIRLQVLNPYFALNLVAGRFSSWPGWSGGRLSWDPSFLIQSRIN